MHITAASQGSMGAAGVSCLPVLQPGAVLGANMPLLSVRAVGTGVSCVWSAQKQVCGAVMPSASSRLCTASREGRQALPSCPALQHHMAVVEGSGQHQRVAAHLCTHMPSV